MKLHSGWMLLAAALPLVSMQTSCGDGERSPQELSDAGTLRLRLTGQSEAGHTYRLRDAELEITGTSSVTLHSEDDPDAESLRHDLPAGAYEILLEDGWFLERQTEDGTFVPVDAVLTSENPSPFEIVAQQTTQVQLRFTAGDEIIDLGDGTLEVSIAVDEEDWESGFGGTEYLNLSHYDCLGLPPGGYVGAVLWDGWSHAFTDERGRLHVAADGSYAWAVFPYADDIVGPYDTQHERLYFGSTNIQFSHVIDPYEPGSTWSYYLPSLDVSGVNGTITLGPTSSNPGSILELFFSDGGTGSGGGQPVCTSTP